MQSMYGVTVGTLESSKMDQPFDDVAAYQNPRNLPLLQLHRTEREKL